MPSAKWVLRINQIAKNRLGTAEPRHDLTWGVGDDKDQKVDQRKCSISGQLTLDATICGFLGRSNILPGKDPEADGGHMHAFSNWKWSYRYKIKDDIK